MDIIKFSLTHKTTTMVIMGLVLVWGIYTFYTIPRNEDPVCHLRTCVVSAIWPGATAKKVEQLITIPIEQAIVGLDEVRRVRSESSAGVSVVFVDLERRGISNLEEAWTKIRNRVSQIVLPEGVYPAQVDSEFGSVEAMVLALYPLYPQKYSYEDLRKLGKTVKAALVPLPYMGRIQILGEQEEVIRLEVSSGLWSKLQISGAELAYALQERNIIQPGGTLDTKLGKYIVRLTGEFETARQIEQVILGSIEKRSPTYLKDMGINVQRVYTDPPSSFCRYSEKDFVAEKCLIISFTMKRGGNIVELGEMIHHKLEEIERDILPDDVKLSIVSDQPLQVRQKTNSLVSNLSSGIYMVVAIGLLLVGLRLSIIMAVSIPMVLISSIAFMPLFGIEIEQVSLAALIVALGMLVDNGIEVSENVHRHMIEGQNRFQAAYDGTREVATSILMGTLTTVMAFLPLLIIPAEEGEFIYSLPVMVSVTLMLSWVIAVTVMMLVAYWFLKPTVVQGGALAFIVRLWIAVMAIVSRIRHGQGEIIPFVRRLWAWVIWRVPISHGEEDTGMKKLYARGLEYCLKRSFLTIVVGMGLCFASFLLLDVIGDQFFPLAYRNQFMVQVWLPAGSPISQTEEVMREVEQIVRDHGEITVAGRRRERLHNMAIFVGRGTTRFYISIDPQGESHNMGQIIVNTTSPSYTDQYVLDVRKDVERKIAGARVSVKKLNLGTSTGEPIALRVVGEDTMKARAIVQEVKKFLAQQPELVELYDDWGDPIYEIELNVDHEVANLAGVTNLDVARTMNTFLDGQYLTTFNEDDHRIPVRLRLPPQERDSVANLYNFYVDGRAGRVPIDGIAQIQTTVAESKIIRRDQERVITVYADTHEEDLPNDVIRKIMPQLEELQKKVPTGYRLEIGGEWEDTRSSDENFNLAFGISLLLIILCLVFTYDGIIKPMIVLSTIPMGFAGSFVGLALSGWPLNFMAFLGLIALAGMTVNSAIVLIDFADIQLKQKLPLYDAVLKASRLRLVPVLMTSFTTVAGLFPLALWGGPLWEPLGYAMAFGLFSATILTLFVVPCIYYFLANTLKIKMIKENLEEKEVQQA